MGLGLAHLLPVATDVPKLDVHFVLPVVDVDVTDIEFKDSCSLGRPVLITREFESIGQKVGKVSLARLKNIKPFNVTF